ncbi:MAG: thioredoxin family protein [Flavobacteriales bacterium]|tara:strand:+ start:1141 stop:1725 length:585 start_codon:yes stop_codon:yes gene_type:complete
MELINKSLVNSLSYNEYRALVTNLLGNNESTTKNGSEDLVSYSKLNNSRMKRLDKTTKLDDSVVNKFSSIDKKITWVVLSEGWCGDAAQNLPVINKLAETNSNINLRIVLRDENPELMNEFLTNGNQAIPKLIQLENEKVTKTWGPRPTIATKMVVDYKSKHGQLDADFKKDLQVWYNKNKSENVIEDLSELIF